MNPSNGTAPIKAYTAKQLAEMNGVSDKIFTGWVEDIADELGAKKGHYFSIRQVEIIFKHYGHPKELVLPKKTTSKEASTEK
jgi:hypothetical protein